MNQADLAYLRLHTQRIAAPAQMAPQALVAELGAVQAQDYAAAKWALGLRLPGLTDTALDQALADGAILRTHVLRPTWHFVTPADIRWLLALTGPRVHAQNGHMYRQLKLDAAAFAAADRVLVGVLAGGQQLTRAELCAAFAQAGLDTPDGLRGTYLIMHAELEGLICSGGRRGKEFTYALLDERAPATPPLPREEALAELARRYVGGHGPATARDFAWWSGLSLTEARSALALIAPCLEQATVDGQIYWFAPPAAALTDQASSVHLLPNYDEYIVAFADRGAIFDARNAHDLDPRGNALFSHTIVSDGRVAGIWKRTLNKTGVTLHPTLLRSLTPAEAESFAAAAARYSAFLQLPVRYQLD